MKIVVTEFIDEAALKAFGAAFCVVNDPTLVDDRSRLVTEIADAVGLIVRNRTRVDQALIDAAPMLRAIGRLGVGLDNIAVDAAVARGIRVLPATGANTIAVAEYVMATTLTLLRGAYFATAAVAAGAWPRNALVGREISGKVIGLVGYGGIARAVGARAHAFGMSVMASDPMLSPNDPAWGEVMNVSLDTLLMTADVVSLHVPLAIDTRNLINAEKIGLMKKNAVLINTARGGVVDEAALALALREKRIGGAALDVFVEEPLSEAHGARFAGIDSVILTPHIAGVTEESNVRVSAVTVDQVMAALLSPRP